MWPVSLTRTALAAAGLLALLLVAWRVGVQIDRALGPHPDRPGRLRVKLPFWDDSSSAFDAAGRPPEESADGAEVTTRPPPGAGPGGQH